MRGRRSRIKDRVADRGDDARAEPQVYTAPLPTMNHHSRHSQGVRVRWIAGAVAAVALAAGHTTSVLAQIKAQARSAPSPPGARASCRSVRKAITTPSSAGSRAARIRRASSTTPVCARTTTSRWRCTRPTRWWRTKSGAPSGRSSRRRCPATSGAADPHHAGRHAGARLEKLRSPTSS